MVSWSFSKERIKQLFKKSLTFPIISTFVFFVVIVLGIILSDPAFSIISAFVFFGVIVLGIILFVTRSLSIMEGLAAIAVISVLMAITVLFLKFSGLAGIIGIRNPGTFPVVDTATTLAIIGLFCMLVVGLFGFFKVPGLIKMQREMLDILRKLRDKLLKGH